MEQSARQSPAPLRILGIALAAVALSALALFLALGALLISTRSELLRAVMLLTRHALRLVPPLAWPVALLIIALWVAILRREWRAP